MVFLYPGINWEILTKLEYLTVYMTLPVFITFINELYPQEFSRIMVRIIQGIGLLMCVLTVVTPARIFSLSMDFFLLYCSFVCFYLLYALIKAAIRRREHSLFVVFCFLFLFVTTMNDILEEMELIHTGELSPLGMFVFLFAQAFILSSRFSRAFDIVEIQSEELKDLNINLENKVEERTEELKAANEEMLAANESLAEARDALWGEMQLAKKIQTVLLNKEPEISGYTIAVHMTPADDVGGDYYDIINIKGYDWIVIGDVAGHGVTSGLIMMMAQTAIHATLEQNPELEPSELLTLINRTLVKNINLINNEKYITITVLAAHKNGTFSHSGLHQDIYIYRSGKGTVDVVETDGAWVGLMDEIGSKLKNLQFELNPGDAMLLYTDGIPEAWVKGSVKGERDPATDMFGDKRLIDLLKKSGKKAPE
ncbi:MAG: SpoIIE family protein phosphatase, partial [bacterium]|nr:SpoIIE family protein phosphatase [bacterium]